MGYVLVGIVGLACGAICVYLMTESKRRQLQEREKRLHDLNAREAALKRDVEHFQSQHVTLTDLQSENATLKTDLRNIYVSLNKVELDRDLQGERQRELDARCNDLASRYLKENVKWIGATLTQNNFVASKKRLQDVMSRCRTIGLDIPSDQETQLLEDLKAEFEKMVRAALEREEQARIKARIREEQKFEREVQREIEQLTRERQAIQAALDKALAEAQDRHSDEVERLRARLAEAEERAQRAVSQAQLTKAGHVYVISNIGSFGESVYKVGLTRRLDPQLRVRELGDASVPFPFDVHMMISSDNAPSLENELRRQLHQHRLNKVNLRKEFFRVELEDIRKIVEEHHGQVEYVADAEALEYRQSIDMSDEDQEYLEDVYTRFHGTDDDE